MPPSDREVLSYQAPRGLKLIGVLVGVMLVVVVVLGVLTRMRADQGLKQAVVDQSVPTVELVPAKADKTTQDLILPADVQAYESATIYARSNGYLKRWYPDIGAGVKRGQTLAEIDTPDLDQQLAWARADLNTARANQTLSRTTEARWKALLAQDAVSQQEYDEKAGDLAAKTSLVAAAQANLGQLQATSAFKRVTAPFDGVVTQRNTDIGQLVSASGAGAPLYTVAEVRKLRVYVRVPQAYTTQIHPGMTADLKAPERPGQSFKAVVVNDSRAINAQSGTLLVQLQIDNADGRLRPGQYMQAYFKLGGGAANVVTVPATALMYRAAGPQVALAGPGDRVLIRSVVIAKDLGTKVQLASGLTARDRVIDNPPDGLGDGDKVRIAAAAPKGGDRG